MKINSKLTKQIIETKYLSSDNTWRYRSIIRYFYLQYEKVKYWMYKEEVLEALKEHNIFKNYTMEMCKQDLDALVEWGNLAPVQDTSKASTVEEFKNKQFRYQITEYTVEIERMAIRLEGLKVESASLEPSLLERLRIDLEKFKTMIYEEESTIGFWWGSLNEDFKRLNQNYQDYIRALYSIKAEEMMRTKEFLVFKDKFIDYLRNFIKGLQQNSYAIEAILKDISEEEEKLLFQKVLDYEKSIPRLDMEIDIEAIKDNINGRWINLKTWFLGDGGLESEVSKLLDTTNEIIRKITRYAFQISESRNSAANKKEEYKKLCKMFLDCKTIKEAHKLSSVAFGIFRTRHIKGIIVRQSESINSGVYEEIPYEVIIKPRVRTYRESRDRSPISNNYEKKQQMLKKIIHKREEEKKIIDGYVKNNVIDFDKLPVIEPYVRTTLLRWISKAISSPNRRGKTEDGRTYRVIKGEHKKYCNLRSKDGIFRMPHFIISFDEEVVS